METFREKQEKRPSSKYLDRQNTKWLVEIARECKHKWQPVMMHVDRAICPTNQRTYVICMECYSHSYIETGYIGFFLGSPCDLEEENKDV